MKGQQKSATKQPSRASLLHKAVSNEMRLEILTILVERSTASPVEIARIMDADVGNVSHHMKQLVKYGCAELVETRQRRGATEHVYRATEHTLLDTPEWEKLPLAARAPFTAQIAQGVTDDLERAFQAQTIDGRTDRHMTRTPLTVDEEGWKELQAIHWRALQETLDVQAKSDARRASSEEDGISVSSSQLCFELPPLCTDRPMRP